MKRKNKCAGKKSFGWLGDAHNQVVKNYVADHRAYGVYECPKCLDFHTTSKYDNRTDKLKRRCFLKLVGGEMPHVQTLLRERYKLMYDHLGTTPL